MNWKPLEFNDKQKIDSALLQDPTSLSDYNFTNLWMWNGFRSYEISNANGFTLIRFTEHGKRIFLYPIGNGPKTSLIQNLMDENPEFEMCRIPEEATYELSSFQLIPEEEHFDYVYRFEDLLNLTGNKYQPKRNLIHQFERNYAYEYKVIDANLLPKIILAEQIWYEEHPDKSDYLLQEHKAALRALDKFMELKVQGGALLIEGNVIAYSFAEYITSEMLVIHVEKAFSAYHGAYQMINQQLLKHLIEVPFVNREEDLGESGLVTAKHSYHPFKILKKFKIA